MIELIVKNYLDSKLSVPALMEKAEEPTDSYCLIEKTSGSKRNHICMATIAVQSYAKSLYEAAALNEGVKTAMEAIITLDSVSSCKLNSDYNFTDQSKKQYRYQAVFDLVYFDD